MTENSETILREPPMAGNEIETMLGSLERQRAYVAWKCGGLDATGMRARLKPSTVTLGGLLKHLALMEDTNFSWPGFARNVAPWNTGDWDADPDWEWHSAAATPPSSSWGCGEKQPPVPAPWSPGPWLRAGWTIRPDSYCQTVSHPACGGS